MKATVFGEETNKTDSTVPVCPTVVRDGMTSKCPEVHSDPTLEHGQGD